jgi:hypothetical protein
VQWEVDGNGTGVSQKRREESGERREQKAESRKQKGEMDHGQRDYRTTRQQERTEGI